MIGERLENFRADRYEMKRLAGSLYVGLVVILIITAHTLSYHDEVRMAREQADAMQERAKQSTALASHYSALVAACMNGDRIVYEDPHSGFDMAVICKSVELGRIPR